jgi:ABC-type antimicrobial peptide transport system permease subunit
MQTNMAIVKPESGLTEKEVAERIEERVNYVTALTEDDRNDLTKPIIEVVYSWNATLQTGLLFLMVVLVAVVGMMNVAERRRDFATLNAMGAPSLRVFSTVIVESSIIGFLGIGLGIVLGSIASVILASLWTTIPYSQFMSDILGIVPPTYMARVLLTGVGACCFGGFLPAVSAIRARVAEALRAEY